MSDLDDWYDSEEYYNDVFLEIDPRSSLIQCSSGTFESLFPLLSSIIVFTFMQRIIFSFDSYLNRQMMDLLVGSLGITFLFYRNVNSTSIIVSLIYFLFGFAFLRIFRTYTYLGPVFIILSLIGTILCQSILEDALFLSFRGSWMIITMKLVSLSFDIHEREFEDVGFSGMFGYIFNPATYFFGFTALLGGFRGSDLKIVDAMKIEIPRSMEEVVSYWNIPMHEFLHKYVYSKTKPISQPMAIILTFLTSALMHGLNFQISAILISLGIFAYSESIFRSRLSRTLNLCIKSRALFINFTFIVVNIVLLVYLGMPFDNSESAPMGYSMSHTLEHWGRWKFGGHGVAVIFLILGKLIYI
ncbi:hypothetical protein FO519_009803 [Halicephalobus sp. NKZ332]|nr:hypothetical protein FO519_009803 [Halicephalobus sp. NKZ332]